MLRDLLQKFAGALLLRVRKELLRGGLLHDDAVLHEDGLGRNVPRKAHLVGDDQHGHPLLGQLAHDREHFARQFRVQGRGGIRSGRFTCPVPPDVYMDMIYMPDALRACVELMEADPAKLVHRNSFNIASMSFTPEIICAEIRKRLPDFTMDYDVDPVKKEIAESWPNSLDDTCAREEWGWKPEWDLSRMTDDMLAHIRTKLAAE